MNEIKTIREMLRSPDEETFLLGIQMIKTSSHLKELEEEWSKMVSLSLEEYLNCIYIPPYIRRNYHPDDIILDSMFDNLLRTISTKN